MSKAEQKSIQLLPKEITAIKKEAEIERRSFSQMAGILAMEAIETRKAAK